MTGNRVTVELDKGVATCAGVQCRDYSGQKFQLNHNLYLFAQNRVPDGRPYIEEDPITCYGCRIYEGGTLVRDFVPCVDDEFGECGLYDRVGGVFYGNASGQGAFLSETPLPDAYEKVEYIESTAGGGQYIDTGYKPNDNTCVTMDVRVNGPNETWFGVWDTDYYRGAYSLANDGRYGGVYVGFGDRGETLAWKDANNKTVSVTGNRVSVELNRGVATCAGVKCRDYSGQEFQLNHNLYIFAQNRVPDGKPYFEEDPITCYGCKIYEGETLKRDYVPCVEKATGEAGLFDRAEGVFCRNAGKGEFLAAGRMASGYAPVEYIRSSGMEYINTGYTPHKGTKVVCRLLDDGTGSSSDYGSIFGSRKGWSRTMGMYFWLRRDGNTQPCYGRAGAQGNKDKADFPFGDVTTVTCEGRNCNWVNDAGTREGGIALSDNYVEEQEDGITPLLIFSLNSSGEVDGCNPSECWGFRLYSFQIYEGAELKLDFVPCVSATEGAGLWDCVEGKFYPNKGGTAFNTP